MENNVNNNQGVPYGMDSNTAYSGFNNAGSYTKPPKKKASKASKIVLGVLVLLLVFVAVLIKQVQDEQIARWMGNQWFVFSDDLESTENVKTLTAEDIEEYEPLTEIYNSEYYYNQLKDNEKLIYKSYLYAIDNNYVYTFIEDSIVNDGKSVLDILVLLSLDSGFLQQNLDATEYEGSQIIYTTIIGKQVEKTVKGSVMEVNNFSAEKLEKIKEAVSKLETVDFKFTDKTTEKEKAKTIYEYIGKNVDYDKKYENQKNVSNKIDYLYEAVFTGKTNCDGFSNAYSLLCGINGIDCFEKNSDDKDDEVGHTWCMVSIDNSWYNVDCTESVDEAKEPDEISRALLFGFPDMMQTYKVECADMLPECTKNLTPVKKVYSEYSYDIVNYISAELKNDPDKTVYVLIKSATEKDVDRLAQNVVNKLYGSIYYGSSDVLNGKIVWIEK